MTCQNYDELCFFIVHYRWSKIHPKFWICARFCITELWSQLWKVRALPTGSAHNGRSTQCLGIWYGLANEDHFNRLLIKVVPVEIIYWILCVLTPFRSNRKRPYTSSINSSSGLEPVAEEHSWLNPDPNFRLSRLSENGPTPDQGIYATANTESAALSTHYY